jgi:hypothetical protein
VLCDNVGEQQIGDFDLARRAAGHGAQPLPPDRDPVALLDEDAARYRAKTAARSCGIRHLPRDEQPQPRPAGENRSRSFIGLGGYHDFNEQPRDRLGG